MDKYLSIYRNGKSNKPPTWDTNPLECYYQIHIFGLISFICRKLNMQVIKCIQRFIFFFRALNFLRVAIDYGIHYMNFVHWTWTHTDIYQANGFFIQLVRYKFHSKFTVLLVVISVFPLPNCTDTHTYAFKFTSGSDSLCSI